MHALWTPRQRTHDRRISKQKQDSMFFFAGDFCTAASAPPHPAHRPLARVCAGKANEREELGFCGSHKSLKHPLNSCCVVHRPPILTLVSRKTNQQETLSYIRNAAQGRSTSRQGPTPVSSWTRRPGTIQRPLGAHRCRFGRRCHIPSCGP